MKGFKYAKTIAKIQASAVFHIRDIRRNVLPMFYLDMYGYAMLVLIRMGTNKANENQ